MDLTETARQTITFVRHTHTDKTPVQRYYSGERKKNKCGPHKIIRETEGKWRVKQR